MEKAVFSVNEFCQRYGESRSDFYRRVASGKISIIKRGRRTFITRAEAERWLASLSVNHHGNNRPMTSDKGGHHVV